MKIAHVITRFMRGGADENTLISCNAQFRAGHEVHLIHGAEFSPDMLSNLDSGVHVHLVQSLVRPVSPLNDVQAFFALNALLRRLNADIVHTHTSKAGILGRAAAVMAGARGIVHGVHILPFVNVPRHQEIAYLAAEKVFAPATHAFVNVSQGMQDIGLQYGVGRAERHFVVPSGMSTMQFQAARPFSAEEKTTLTGRPDAPLLVFVAALEPRKRQYEFLDAMAAVARAKPEALLVLLGEGTDEERLRRRVEALGLQSNVLFAGFSDEVERWIASADVCVFASEREGLPRAVIQYAMGRRPIVSTHLPGIEAVVIDGVTGHLVPVSDVAAMTAPILSLLESEQKRAEMSEAAKVLDFSRWDATAMTDELERIYGAVLEQRARAPA